MSKAVRLHPLVVILGFVVGGLSFGILGAILATPVIASVKAIVSYIHSKIRGLPVEGVRPTMSSGSQQASSVALPLRPTEPPRRKARSR
jgi:hypothetical protein